MFITIQTVLHKQHSDSYVLIYRGINTRPTKFRYGVHAESIIQTIQKSNVVVKTECYATICGITGLPINVISTFVRIV